MNFLIFLLGLLTGGALGVLLMGLLTPEEEKCDSVVGNLTAIDVFLRIKNHWLYGTDWLKHYYSGE